MSSGESGGGKNSSTSNSAPQPFTGDSSTSSPVVLPASRIRELYETVANDIDSHEKTLIPELPISQPYGLGEELQTLIERWEAGEKSLRTVPVLNAYALAFPEPIYETTGRALVSLDAFINVLDDIIDTSNLSVEQKIGFTSNAAFSSTELLRTLPPETLTDAAACLQPYFTMLFQIPAVEKRLLNSLRTESDPTKQRAIAVEIYRYRSRGMEAFAELAALIQSKITDQSLDTDTIQRIQRDLRTHRARTLLYKDVRDIIRDAADKDPTPVLSYLRATQCPSDTADFITQVGAAFEYSEQSENTYREALSELEPRPTHLEQVLADKARTIDSG